VGTDRRADSTSRGTDLEDPKEAEEDTRRFNVLCKRFSEDSISRKVGAFPGRGLPWMEVQPGGYGVHTHTHLYMCTHAHRHALMCTYMLFVTTLWAGTSCPGERQPGASGAQTRWVLLQFLELVQKSWWKNPLGKLSDLSTNVCKQ
jgi:hypothetical protein